MKKIGLFLVAIMSMLVVTGCQSPAVTEQSSTHSQLKTEKATIIIEQEGKELTKKMVEYQPEQTLLQVLQQHFKVEEDNGFITAIDHHAQDKEKGIYWTFTINGKMAEKGASEIKLANNDKVVFNLAPFK